MIKPYAPRWLKIIAAAYAIYLALVLLVGTPLLNMLAPKIYREQTGTELNIARIIWLNPFTLSVSIKQASSTLNAQDNSTAQTPFWSFDELNVNLSLASLWRRHLVLDQLALRGLDLQIDQTAPDRFNFSAILDYREQHFPAQPEAKPATTSSAEPPAIEITELEFTSKHLGYRAPHASEPINAAINDLNFTLADFSTLAETKTATPSAHDQNLRGKNILLGIKTISVEFLREQYPFKTTLHDFAVAIPALATSDNSAYDISVHDNGNGRVQIKGNVDLAQHSADGHAQLRALSVLPAWQFLANKLAFDMNDARDNQGARIDGDIHYAVNWSEKLHYRLENSSLAVNTLQLQARNDSASRVGFETLQVRNIHVDSSEPRAQIGDITIDKLSIAGWNKDTQLSLVNMFAFTSDEAPSESPPWQIQVDSVAIKNSALNWHASQIDHLPLAFSALDIQLNHVHWPDATSMQLDLKTTLNDTAELALNGELIPSTQSGELHADIHNLPLAWGDVFVRQQMRATIVSGALNASSVITLENAQPIRLTSEGSIDNFELQTRNTLADNTGQRTQKITADNRTADTRKLAAWKQLRWQQMTLAIPQQRIDIKRAVLTQPWAQFRINADGSNNFQQLMVQTTESSQDQKPWQFALDNLHIDSGTVIFRDASLTSAFRTDLTGLSGDINNINSAKAEPSQVGLRGTVDGYAPVALTGHTHLFAETPQLDIAIDMTNLDLATLTPYSGTYAGYQIESGRLTVQLVYKLQDGRIKGTNHIIVNQMQLGKQVGGPKVMDLPLRFAIYLLTDSDGVMDLGVDVTGNVDDPDFSVGSIIWKAFRNLIVKTVAAPFKALAGLVGSNRDDLDYVQFHPGGEQIVEGETEKLQAVNAALKKKSELKLGVTGHISPSQDIEALRDRSLSQQLITQDNINPTDIREQSKNWQRAVVKLFKKRFPDEDTERWQVMQMNDAMRDNVELEPLALQQLAARRALAVKQVLVTDMGLAAKRAFVKPADLGDDKNQGLKATLEVQ